MKNNFFVIMMLAISLLICSCSPGEKNEEKLPEALLQESGAERGDVEEASSEICFESENYAVDLDMMTYYYFTDVYNMYQSYGQYLAYMSPDQTAPDFSKPLSGQSYDSENEKSWQDYFLDTAIQKTKLIMSYAEEAKLQGFESNAENLAEKYMDNIRGFAKTEGIGFEEYLVKYYGENITEEVVKNALVLQYIASEYQTAILKELEASVTDEQLEEYKAGLVNDIDESPTRDVCHILFTANTYGTSEAAKAKADEVHELYLSGERTQEAFEALGAEYNEDGNCIYSGVTTGQMVEPFETWLFDETRIPGDTGVVETEYGYHIMFYVGEGLPVWKTEAIDSIVGEIYQDDVAAMLDVHNKAIVSNDEIVALIPDLFPENAF